jgi:CelD/BcsL family acetyltransferase involved in cellulose biosynthesis
MRVDRITYADFAGLADCWDCLTRGVPFRSWTWVDAWWRHYRRGREFCVLTVRDDLGQLVGAAPWCFEETKARGRVLRFLGSGEARGENLSLLATAEHEDAVAQAIAHWLMHASEHKPDHWDLLALERVVVEDRMLMKLLHALNREGCSTYRSADEQCWRIDLPSEWDAYLASMSKSHRKQIRRTEQGVQLSALTVHASADTAGAQPGFDLLRELHQERAASLNEPGLFASGAFCEFYRDVMPRLLAQQRLQLHWVAHGDKPIAAELYLLGSAVSYGYLAGLAPDALDLEPSRVLHLAVIKQAIAEGQYRLENSHGDQPFKAHWRAQSHMVTDLHVVPPSTRAQVRHGAWRVSETMRHLLRSGFMMK